MPYIKLDRRQAVEKDVKEVKTFGEAVYLFTTIMIKAWMVTQSFDTLFALSMLRLRPETPLNGTQEVWELRQKLLTQAGRRFTVTEVQNSIDMAYFEFYHRVGKNYEHMKCKSNGDVFENVPYTDSVYLIGDTQSLGGGTK